MGHWTFSYRYSWKKALLVRNKRKWLLFVDLGRGYWTLPPQGISFLGLVGHKLQSICYVKPEH